MTIRILASRRGATAVEFALLAPVFLMCVFSIIEGGRMLWLQETLNEIAFSTARCISVSTDCDTAARQKSYAVARAARYGQTLGDGAVVPVMRTRCNGMTGMSRVTITMGFNSPVAGLLPGVPATISADGCFPDI